MAEVVIASTISQSDAWAGSQKKMAFANNRWYVFYADAGDIWYKKSTDDTGSSFGSAVQVNTTANTVYVPAITLVGSTIHIVYYDTTNDSFFYRTLDTSTDTLSTEKQSQDFGVFQVAGTTYKSMIAVDSNGRIYVYETYNPTIAYSDDQGTTWTEITGVDNNSGNVVDMVCIGTNLHIVQYDSGVSGLEHLIYNGTTWSSPTTIQATNITNPTPGLGVDNAGNLWLTFPHAIISPLNYYIACWKYTGSWAEKTRVAENQSSGIQVHTNHIIINTNNNNVYVIWIDHDGSSNDVIWWSKSTDGGTTWSARADTGITARSTNAYGSANESNGSRLAVTAWNGVNSQLAFSFVGVFAEINNNYAKANILRHRGNHTITQDTDTNNVNSIAGGTGGAGETEQGWAQQFVATGTKLKSVRLKTWKWNTPTDDMVVTITSSLGGSSLGSISVPAASVAAGGNTTFTFTNPISLTEGSTYYVEITRSGARDTTNRFAIYIQFATNPYKEGEIYKKENNAWSADGTSTDFRFELTFEDFAQYSKASIVFRQTQNNSAKANIKTTNTDNNSAKANIKKTTLGNSAPAVDFKKNSSYVAYTLGPAGTAQDNWTMETRARFKSITNDQVLLINGRDDGASVFSGYAIVLHNNHFSVLYPGISWYEATDITPSIDTDYNIIAVRRSGTLELWVNGVQTDLTSVATPNLPAGSVVVGLEIVGGVRSADAVVDTARIYSRAITTTEIAEHQMGVYSNNTSLELLWNFTEGTGTSVADTSGNSRNGTFSSSPAPVWTMEGIATVNAVKAAIIRPNSTQSQSAKADIITQNVTKATSAKADIIVTNSQANSAKAKIIFLGIQANSAKAWIVPRQDSYAKADIIRANETKDNTAKANLVFRQLFGVQSIGNVKVTQPQANSAKADIIRAGETKDNSARANIKQVWTQYVKANIRVNNNYQDSYARARIGSSYLQDASTRGYIQGRPTQKRYEYRIYDDNTYVITWSSEVISEPNFRTVINGGPSELNIRLARKFDDFGEDLDVKLNNRVDLWVFDRDEPNGLRLYRGYISGYRPVLDGSNEFVEITVLSYLAQTSGIMLREVNGNTDYVLNSVDPTTILNQVIERNAAYGGFLSLGAVDTTGTVVSYTFESNTIKEALDKVIELSPEGWYYFVDADGTVEFHARPTDPTHILRVGREITELETWRRMEDIVNEVFFVGGGSPQMFRYYKNDGSIATYGRRSVKKIDQRVTVEATADTISQRLIEAKKDPEIRTRVVLSDNNSDLKNGYDIESIKVGDTFELRNLKQGVKTVTLWDVGYWDEDVWDQTLAYLATSPVQILSIDYSPDEVVLEASSRIPEINKRIEDINRNYEQGVLINNPTAPTAA